ncbi:MAG: galactose oxidase-like domain-containing protein [Povalibacter sp.]
MKLPRLMAVPDESGLTPLRADVLVCSERKQSFARTAAKSSRSNLARILATAAVAVAAASAAHADPTRGAWLSPAADNWPLIPIHAALTPDGRVLTFGTNGLGAQTGYFIYDIWDPADGLSGPHLTLDNRTLTDTFCSSMVILPGNGDILIAGGDNWDGTATTNTGNNNSNLFDPGSNTLTRASNMKRPRWYSSATTLMNGEVYIQGGRGGYTQPEVRQNNGSFRSLTAIDTSTYSYYYPRNFLAPDGRVFGFDVAGKMYYVATAGVGAMSPAAQLANQGAYSSSAMFRPGKILQVNGYSNQAIVIDINGAQPVVTPTASLSSRRSWGNATVLPDGRVLVTGGSSSPNKLINVNNSAEIWNPATGTWTLGASGQRARLYHSVALLLPDGSVMVGGGGAAPDAPVNNLHSEIYYPPYLYDAPGHFASRPSITSAPDTLLAGQPFTVGVNSTTIQRVTLVKTGAVTHSFNMDQRFVELAFTASDKVLSIEMPSRATDIPPGYYLMFVINSAGRPSRGRMVRVGVDTIAPRAPQNLVLARVTSKVKLTWTASTDLGGIFGYTIHRSTNGSLGPEIARVSATTWTDATVQEGVGYAYAVKAFDSASNFSPASALKTIVPFQLPTTPGSFTVTLTNGDPRLNWTASTDNVRVVGYNIYRSTNGALGPLFAMTAAAPWVDSSATAGVRYTYAIRARDAAGYLSSATALRTVTAL